MIYFYLYTVIGNNYRQFLVWPRSLSKQHFNWVIKLGLVGVFCFVLTWFFIFFLILLFSSLTFVLKEACEEQN